MICSSEPVKCRNACCYLCLKNLILLWVITTELKWCITGKVETKYVLKNPWIAIKKEKKNQRGLNKSTTVFHGLYYCIINHRNDIIIFKTQVKPFWHHWLSLWSIRVQTIEHFCWFVFYNNIRSFDLHFCWKFLASCLTREKEKSKLCHHVILMVCTLIKCRFPPINVQEIGQLL